MTQKENTSTNLPGKFTYALDQGRLKVNFATSIFGVFLACGTGPIEHRLKKKKFGAYFLPNRTKKFFWPNPMTGC